MKTITHTPVLDLAAEQQELTTIALESLGWVPLEPGAYLNLAGDKIYYEYDFAAARELLRQALTLAPRHPGVHLLLGTIASYEARLDEALQHLDAAHELDPLYPAIRANRGVAWLFCGHYTEAARVFSELLALHPQRNATRVSLANALTLLGETDSAIRAMLAQDTSSHTIATNMDAGLVYIEDTFPDRSPLRRYRQRTWHLTAASHAKTFPEPD